MPNDDLRIKSKTHSTVETTPVKPEDKKDKTGEVKPAEQLFDAKEPKEITPDIDLTQCAIKRIKEKEAEELSMLSDIDNMAQIPLENGETYYVFGEYIHQLLSDVVRDTAYSKQQKISGQADTKNKTITANKNLQALLKNDVDAKKLALYKEKFEHGKLTSQDIKDMDQGYFIELFIKNSPNKELIEAIETNYYINTFFLVEILNKQNSIGKLLGYSTPEPVISNFDFSEGDPSLILFNFRNTFNNANHNILNALTNYKQEQALVDSKDKTGQVRQWGKISIQTLTKESENISWRNKAAMAMYDNKYSFWSITNRLRGHIFKQLRSGQMSEEEFSYWQNMLAPRFADNGTLLSLSAREDKIRTNVAQLLVNNYLNIPSPYITRNKLSELLKIDFTEPVILQKTKNTTAEQVASDTKSLKHYKENCGYSKLFYNWLLEKMGSNLTFSNLGKTESKLKENLEKLFNSENDKEFAKNFKEITNVDFNPVEIKKYLDIQAKVSKYQHMITSLHLLNIATKQIRELRSPNCREWVETHFLKKQCKENILNFFKIFNTQEIFGHNYKDLENANLESLIKIFENCKDIYEPRFKAEKQATEEELSSQLNCPPEDIQENIQKAFIRGFGETKLSQELKKIISLHQTIDTSIDTAIFILSAVVSGGLSTMAMAHLPKNIQLASFLLHSIKQLPNATLTLKNIIDECGTADGISKNDWERIFKQTAIRFTFQQIGAQTGKISEVLQEKGFSICGAKLAEWTTDAAICTAVDYGLSIESDNFTETFKEEFRQNIKSMLMGLIVAKIQPWKMDQKTKKSYDNLISISTLFGINIADLENRIDVAMDNSESGSSPDTVYKEFAEELDKIINDTDLSQIETTFQTKRIIYSSLPPQKPGDKDCVTRAMLNSEQPVLTVSADKISFETNGRVITLDSLKNIDVTDPCEFAKAFGYATRVSIDAKTCTATDIQRMMRSGMICLVENGHALSIKQVDTANNRILVQDPADNSFKWKNISELGGQKIAGGVNNNPIDKKIDDGSKVSATGKDSQVTEPHISPEVTDTKIAAILPSVKNIKGIVNLLRKNGLSESQILTLHNKLSSENIPTAQIEDIIRLTIGIAPIIKNHRFFSGYSLELSDIYEIRKALFEETANSDAAANIGLLMMERFPHKSDLTNLLISIMDSNSYKEIDNLKSILTSSSQLIDYSESQVKSFPEIEQNGKPITVAVAKGDEVIFNLRDSEKLDLDTIIESNFATSELLRDPEIREALIKHIKTSDETIKLKNSEHGKPAIKLDEKIILEDAIILFENGLARTYDIHAITDKLKDIVNGKYGYNLQHKAEKILSTQIFKTKREKLGQLVKNIRTQIGTVSQSKYKIEILPHFILRMLDRNLLLTFDTKTLDDQGLPTELRVAGFLQKVITSIDNYKTKYPKNLGNRQIKITDLAGDNIEVLVNIDANGDVTLESVVN